MAKLQNLISWWLLQQLKILNIAPVAPKGTIPSLSYSSVANAILSKIPYGTWCASHAGAPCSSISNNHDRRLRFRRSSSQIGENWNFNDKSKELGAADEESTDSTMLYFHVSPSGDWWTGPSIFAAKHLQPDYVRSIPIPPGFDPHVYFGDSIDNDEDDEEINGQNQNEKIKITTHVQEKVHLSWEEQRDLLYKIYDEKEFPAELLHGCQSNVIKE